MTAGTPGRSWTLGRLAMGLLGVTVSSGAALAPFYRAGAALESTEAIQAGIPWAWWIRGIHFYAAHALLLVTLAHAVEVLAYRGEQRIGRGAWWGSVLSLPMLVAAMLGGFVMRGDFDAGQAASVWKGLLQSIPLVGGRAAHLLLGGGGLDTVAMHHAGTFTLLVWVMAAMHGGRLWPDLRAAVVGALASLSVAAFLPPGLGTASGTSSGAASGPWYMLGLQGALGDVPPLAVLCLSLVPLVALGMVRHARGTRRTLLLYCLGACVAAWIFWTLGLLASGGVP